MTGGWEKSDGRPAQRQVFLTWPQ